MTIINRSAFFAKARMDVFAGFLKQGQVDGTNRILAEWDSRALTDHRWLAYILATAFWETGATMEPVNEQGGDAYFFRMYDKDGDRPAVAKMLGNTEAGDGIRFHGRGYPQLTGRANYKHMGDLLGIDLVGNPDLACDPVHSIRIMFEGMLRADSHFGDFTGVALDDFFTEGRADWVSARLVVNDHDHAADIAAIGRKFYAALMAAVSA